MRGTLHSPGFQADAARMGLELNEVAGETMARILNEAYAVPTEVVKVAAEAMSVATAPGE